MANGSHPASPKNHVVGVRGGQQDKELSGEWAGGAGEAVAGGFGGGGRLVVASELSLKEFRIGSVKGAYFWGS